MLFMLNIEELIIIHIIRVVSCYLIINWIVFEFVNFDTIIIRVVFGLANTMEYICIDTTQTRHMDMNCHP